MGTCQQVNCTSIGVSWDYVVQDMILLRHVITVSDTLDI